MRSHQDEWMAHQGTRRSLSLALDRITELEDELAMCKVTNADLTAALTQVQDILDCVEEDMGSDYIDTFVGRS